MKLKDPLAWRVVGGKQLRVSRLGLPCTKYAMLQSVSPSLSLFHSSNCYTKMALTHSTVQCPILLAQFLPTTGYMLLQYSWRCCLGYVPTPQCDLSFASTMLLAFPLFCVQSVRPLQSFPNTLSRHCRLLVCPLFVWHNHWEGVRGRRDIPYKRFACWLLIRVKIIWYSHWQ